MKIIHETLTREREQPKHIVVDQYKHKTVLYDMWDRNFAKYENTIGIWNINYKS